MKLLMSIRGKPLIQHAWERCVARFGQPNVVLACPQRDAYTFAKVLPKALIYPYGGPEWDVLSRLHACAHRFRTDPLTPVHRITPDDYPVELDREVFTLAQLDETQARIAENDRPLREHVGYALPLQRYTAGPEVIEVNTLDDLARANR